MQQKSIKKGAPCSTLHFPGVCGSVCMQGMNFWPCCQGSRGVHWGTGERVTGHRLSGQLIWITTPSLGQAGGAQGIGYRTE